MKTYIQLCILLVLMLAAAGAGADDGDYGKGLRLFKSGDYKNAVVCLEKYVAQRPDPAAYYMLGYACYQLRDFARAREYFDEAYLIDPEFTYGKISGHSALFDEELKLIHELLEISGAKEQISYYADVVGSGLPQLGNDMPGEGMRQELMGLIREAYRFDKIYPSVVQVFQARFQKEHILSALSWLKTPVGRRMTALEIRANSPEAMQKVEAFAGEYRKIAGERRNLLVRLEKAVNATEMNIEVVSASLLEMLAAMQAQTPGKNRLTAGQIDALVEKIRNMPREQLKDNVMVLLAYTYRELTDRELETAIQFYETPAGRWFNATSIKAVATAIGKASREIGEMVGKSLLVKNSAV